MITVLTYAGLVYLGVSILLAVFFGVAVVSIGGFGEIAQLMNTMVGRTDITSERVQWLMLLVVVAWVIVPVAFWLVKRQTL